MIVSVANLPDIGGCSECPIDWGSDCTEYMCQDKKYVDDESGLYTKWVSCCSPHEAALLAYKISKLPEKGGS